jgi:hypothetical protein
MGIPSEMLGWMQVDLIGRALLGNKPQSEGIPVRLLTKGNLGKSDSFTALFGKFDFRSAFRTLWGV